jgi:hypothetical protein
MKKFATILVLLFVLSVSVFADEGGYPIGGKSCPQGQQTCLTDGTTHSGGKADNTIIKEIFDFLKLIFG